MTFLLINTDTYYPITWNAPDARLDTDYTYWASISPSGGIISPDGSVEVTLTFMSSICQFVQQQGGFLSYSIGMTYSTALGLPKKLDQYVDVSFG